MSDYQYTSYLDPELKTSLKIFLFKNVNNVDDIRKNIIGGVWKCAAIKPSLVLDPFQVIVAANRAAIAEKFGNMITKTVHSEIIYNLSISKNISQSLKKFGIDQDESLLLCFLSTDDDNEFESVVKQVDGEQCPLTELSRYTDIKQVKDVYKLGSVGKDTDLLDIIVSRIVTKNFVTF
ncbi:EKC/KEOPS complex subunit Tprkb-like [Leptidea sinapis]|uniref:EKC/KEOPS complex subunit CGI121 n=1 Tax=Leptidea sinapis TaxID=189913 RepID=A0A5E4QEG9_9NEOP|nr:EKC/KEOPS complex subunit Tprkb-like [Leptidea sinapis]VVC95480.1 unnamed protein product [Leptidea sinapis]